MPRVGRPRTSTDAGSRAPTSELGVPYLNSGISGIAGGGASFISGNGPWRMYIDEWEYIPELQWPNSVWLFNQMRSDEQLSALLTAVMWGIAQLRYVIDPNGCDEAMVKEVSANLNLPILGEEDQPRGRMKNRFSHSQHIVTAMLAAIYGHMYFEQVGTIIDGKWQLRKLAPRMPQTIRQINVADDGGLVSVDQWGPANLRGTPFDFPSIPVDRLVGYIFQQEGMSWTGRSMMRDCYRSWLLKDRLLRIEVINHERAGGVPYANAPMGATADEVDALDLMMQNFRIGETAGAALPYGAELNIAKGSNSDIDTTIKRLDEGMARKFLLMLVNLAQGGQHVGSYALGETFEDFFIVGQRQIAQWYCDTTTEHVIEDMIDWNYGPDTERTPYITWERSSEDSLGSDNLANLVDRGVITMDMELENWVRYRYLLPKKKEPRPEITPGGPKQPVEQVAQRQGAQSGTVPGADPKPQAVAPSSTAASGEQVLPPSSDVAASFTLEGSKLAKLFKRKKPDVSAAVEYDFQPSVSNIRGVPVLEAGVEYRLSTGPTTFTPEDLEDVVCAINEDFSMPKPRLGIGHIDPRFNEKTFWDGEPTWGTITNASLNENGTVVYADYTNVPTWLAKLLPFAFPSRSIEGFWGIESDAGRKYRFVLSACKVLGIQWPGINKLEDLPSYFGEDMPADVVVDPQIIAAAQAAANLPGGDPMKLPWNRLVAASANLDDIRRAFNDERQTKPERQKWWIRKVLVDPNEVVAEDNDSGQLYRLSYATSDRGEVTFSDPEPVRVALIPEDRPELLKSAASATAELLATGREVLASWSSQEESSLEVRTGGTMDPKEVRSKLKLPEDASDEQVQEALLAAAGITAESPEGPAAPAPALAPAPEPTPAPAPASAPAEPQQGAQVIPFPTGSVPPGMVLVDKAALDTALGVAAKAGTFISDQEKKARENEVAAAIGDGRIPPASKDHWLGLLEKDPNAGQVLASLAPGIVPMTERGHAHSPDAAATLQEEAEAVSAWSAKLFPEVQQSRVLATAAAAGDLSQRPRVTTDAATGRR